MPESVVPSNCRLVMVGKVRLNTLRSAYNADSRIRNYDFAINVRKHAATNSVKKRETHDEEAITENLGQSLISLQILRNPL